METLLDTHPLLVLSAVVMMAVNVTALLGGLWRLHRVGSRLERIADYFAIEHELLVEWYCKEHNIPKQALSTRIEKPRWWK